MEKTYSKSFKWRVDIENLYICLPVTSLKRQILKFYYSIVRLRQHRRGLHTAKSLDILKISCFNCNVDKKKEKNKMKRYFKNKSSYASLEKNLAENNM